MYVIRDQFDLIHVRYYENSKNTVCDLGQKYNKGGRFHKIITEVVQVYKFYILVNLDQF